MGSFVMTIKSWPRMTALLAAILLAAPWRASGADDPIRTVGPQRDGSIVASSNQTLTPAGTIVELGSPVVAKAVALNPNKKARSGAVLLMGSPQPVIVFDTGTGKVLQRFTPTSHDGKEFTTDKTGSFTGITYSADGTRLFFSQDDNHVVIAKVNPATGLIANGQSLTLPPPPADGRPYHNAKSINPGGIAVAPDGKHAYVALNAANTLGVIDLTGQEARLTAQIPVGNAPNSVAIHGRYAYVSNEGGRPAAAGDYTSNSDGTPIVADPRNAFAITGTVSVVDLAAGKEIRSIPVGLHPAGMTVSGDRLYVANSYSDSVSVIDLNGNAVIRTIPIGVPVKGGAFGSGPNAVAVAGGGGQAFVTLGQANAVAVVNLAGRDINPVVGYIPTAYFPTSIAYDAPRKQLVVVDDKGLGARGVAVTNSGVAGFNTHQEEGTINLLPLPSAAQLAKFTRQVIANNHWNLTTNIQVGPEYIDRNARPVAVPRHIGEPSLIKYVFLVIKENRTYDQMLGDVAWANGDPALAIFASALPNQHALVKRFPVLDNVYAPSRQSADGHPWIGMSGSFYSNDILSPDWIRSYPGGNSEDALTYTPKGFLWTAAEAKGLTARLYGEWSDGTKLAKKPDGTAYSWTDFYNTVLCKEGKAPASSCVVPDNVNSSTSSIPSAARILDPHYPAFDLTIPDQYRMDYWIPVFQKQVDDGQVPSLTILWLPNDHTNGTTKGYPYPVNYQADNDLALGRMVEAISHSKIWSQSAIFVEEDDSQGGVDHVDGHRQPVYVISPYAAAPQAPGQGKAIHTTYTAENINRTIENILGMQPLTQFDLVASPMFDVFQNTPDLAPFDHLPATIPLDQGPGLGGNNTANATPLQKAWLAATGAVMKDKITRADAADPDFLNHVTWYSATNWTRPYPGESKIQKPDALLKAARNYKGDDDD
jgi:YVTN family beta-propeller protein